jgi:cytidylate kinase
MSRRAPVIAIDGPAGAGKSTAARRLAARLGFKLVDTGALYRGLALCASEAGVDLNDAVSVGDLARTLDLDFDRGEDGRSRLLVGGIDRDDEIRTETVAAAASVVSRHPEVREALLGIQRRFGARGGVVLEGRDIGTVVFPDAEVKVFLTASPEERAKRRVSDLRERGIDADPAIVADEIRERDHKDASREIAPLKPAGDARIFDTTDLGLDEVLERLVAMVEAASR